jgi:hypothetical protein
MQQRGGQRDLLAHAGGVVHHRHAVRRVQLQDTQQLFRPLDGRLAGHAAQQAQVEQDLVAGQPVRQRQAVRQHADQRLGGDRIAPHVPAGDRGRAAVRPQQAHGHRERRGLARAVRAHQAEKRPARYLQVDVIDGHVVAELLEQSGEFQREHACSIGQRHRHRPVF